MKEKGKTTKWLYWFIFAIAVIIFYKLLDNLTSIGTSIKNFFGILKNEMYYGHENEFKSIEELKQAISDYIDNYYNTKRINIKRKGLSPFEYRQKSLSLVL